MKYINEIKHFTVVLLAIFVLISLYFIFETVKSNSSTLQKVFTEPSCNREGDCDWSK